MFLTEAGAHFNITFWITQVSSVAEQGVGVANRGAHIYLTPGGNTPCSATECLDPADVPLTEAKAPADIALRYKKTSLLKPSSRNRP